MDEARRSVVDGLVGANRRYAAAFSHGHLPAPPSRRIAVVTCMDARLDPAEFLGLEEGDAHVIRNAGGVVSDDALRSLVISHWLLGTSQAIVIGHTDCGMATFSNEDLRAKLLEQAGADASGVDFLPFDDVEQSVRQSVERVRGSTLLPDSYGVNGFVYDVRTGRIAAVA